MTRETINQVRELLDRNLSTAEIAQRMNIDIVLARIAIDGIKRQQIDLVQLDNI